MGGAEGSTALGRLPECQAPRVSSSPVTSTGSWPGAPHPRMRDQDQSNYSQGYVDGLLRDACESAWYLENLWFPNCRERASESPGGLLDSSGWAPPSF